MYGRVKERDIMNFSPIHSGIKPENKVYKLKKSPIKKKPYLIPKISRKKRKQNYIEHKEWLRILERCQGLCEYCHKPPDFRGLHPHEIIFRSHMGKLTYENSKASCGKCHSGKHGITEV